MAWIICEGLDRSGKSTLAEQYRQKGYIVHHMSAPSKKYSQSGYTGPSYLDECLDLYMSLDGKDVFFDRTIYGELIWPQVYNREPQLTEDDLDVLKDYELNNGATYIVMHDPNDKAHWERCVQNKENLTKSQFFLARKLFQQLTKYGFTEKCLSDFVQKIETKSSEAVSAPAVAVVEQECVHCDENIEEAKTPQELKLLKANAINDILSKRIIKKQSPVFDDIEKELRNFLEKKLASLFGDNIESEFTQEEIDILKTYVTRLKTKMREAR